MEAFDTSELETAAGLHRSLAQRRNRITKQPLCGGFPYKRLFRSDDAGLLLAPNLPLGHGLERFATDERSATAPLLSPVWLARIRQRLSGAPGLYQLPSQTLSQIPSRFQELLKILELPCRLAAS